MPLPSPRFTIVCRCSAGHRDALLVTTSRDRAHVERLAALLDGSINKEVRDRMRALPPSSFFTVGQCAHPVDDVVKDGGDEHRCGAYFDATVEDGDTRLVGERTVLDIGPLVSTVTKEAPAPDEPVSRHADVGNAPTCGKGALENDVPCRLAPAHDGDCEPWVKPAKLPRRKLAFPAPEALRGVQRWRDGWESTFWTSLGMGDRVRVVVVAAGVVNEVGIGVAPIGEVHPGHVDAGVWRVLQHVGDGLICEQISEPILHGCPRCPGMLHACVADDDKSWEADRCARCGGRWWHDPPKLVAAVPKTMELRPTTPFTPTHPWPKGSTSTVDG